MPITSKLVLMVLLHSVTAMPTVYGRYWFQVSHIMPEGTTEAQIETLDLIGDELPDPIDVLAMNQRQAINIAKQSWPDLCFAEHIYAVRRGTERQFQKQCEPRGEEQLDFLPF